jgi:hypothetical protein
MGLSLSVQLEIKENMIKQIKKYLISPTFPVPDMPGSLPSPERDPKGRVKPS